MPRLVRTVLGVCGKSNSNDRTNRELSHFAVRGAVSIIERWGVKTALGILPECRRAAQLHNRAFKGGPTRARTWKWRLRTSSGSQAVLCCPFESSQEAAGLTIGNHNWHTAPLYRHTSSKFPLVVNRGTITNEMGT